jgi:hypothetical protein
VCGVVYFAILLIYFANLLYYTLYYRWALATARNPPLAASDLEAFLLGIYHSYHLHPRVRMQGAPASTSSSVLSSGVTTILYSTNLTLSDNFSFSSGMTLLIYSTLTNPLFHSSSPTHCSVPHPCLLLPIPPLCLSCVRHRGAARELACLRGKGGARRGGELGDWG